MKLLKKMAAIFIMFAITGALILADNIFSEISANAKESHIKIVANEII